MRFFATCARGLEPILAEELRALRMTSIEPGRGGVSFVGDTSAVYRANLWLRTAIRVLKPILNFHVESPDELYSAVQGIDWSLYLTVGHTFAIDANVRDSKITHSLYAALRTKDAIVDQFMAREGRRPSVDTETPMVGLNLHIYRDEAVLSLDSSGESLHKRGYRPILTKAPLNEALAAALVLRSGWKATSAFADPLCGSGTLPIESAWIALGRPPGLTRKRFGFQGWMDFDIALWTAVRDEARRGVKKQLCVPIIGSDIRSDAVEFARTNARAAGIGNRLQFQRTDIREFRPPDGDPGTILCNPPYGERIGEEKELRPLYRSLGDLFALRCRGWACWVFTGNQQLAAEIDLPVKEQVEFWNGKIPCRLLHLKND